MWDDLGHQGDAVREGCLREYGFNSSAAQQHSPFKTLLLTCGRRGRAAQLAQPPAAA